MQSLKGAGGPLAADLSGDVAANVGFRIIAEAGALPREIQLRKAIEEQRTVLQAAMGQSVEKPEMAKLAELQQRLAIEEEARRRFYGKSQALSLTAMGPTSRGTDPPGPSVTEAA